MPDNKVDKVNANEEQKKIVKRALGFMKNIHCYFDPSVL